MRLIALAVLRVRIRAISLFLSITVFSACCSVAFAADNEASSRLLKARSLKCEFGPGNQAEWKGGVLTVRSGRWSSSSDKSASIIHYDGIDLNSGKARVIGAGGSADLFAFSSPVALTLIELVPVGGVSVTTIYGSYDAKRAFPAVIAKHVDIFGPFPQQYYGACILSE